MAFFFVHDFSAGTIRIFTEFNKMKPLLEVNDASPITNLKYISFGGEDKIHDFFYNCSQVSNNVNQTNIF